MHLHVTCLKAVYNDLVIFLRHFQCILQVIFGHASPCDVLKKIVKRFDDYLTTIPTVLCFTGYLLG